MQSKAKTVDQYLAELPEDRREALTRLRAVFRKNLDKKIIEHINYGMIGYSVPHSVYPPGYHCDPKLPLPVASMASQKNHLAIYLFCHYIDAEEQQAFVKAWKATGKKLDMGKSCIRFKKIDDVPLDVLAASIRRLDVKRVIGVYEAAKQTWSAAKSGRATKSSKAAATKKATAKRASASWGAGKKATTKKAATRKAPSKRAASRKTAKK